MCCISGTVLLKRCVISLAVGTCTMLSGTCLNASIFKLPAFDQRYTDTQCHFKICVKTFIDSKLTKIVNTIAISGRLNHL